MYMFQLGKMYFNANVIGKNMTCKLYLTLV